MMLLSGLYTRLVKAAVAALSGSSSCNEFVWLSAALLVD